MEGVMDNQQIWDQYYQKALALPHKKRTEYAVQLNQSGLRVAVDCGCGTGSDIAYLNGRGYTVHGFDNNPQAIGICKERFKEDDNVYLVAQGFDEFAYPKTGILIANSSLYFAAPKTWQITWESITNALQPKGVFVGDFMGVKDSWANQYRNHTLPLELNEIVTMFEDFDILQLNVRDELGTTAIGKEKHWHTYSVIAVKN